MSNQLCYYSFTITKPKLEKDYVTYTTRSPNIKSRTKLYKTI